MSRTPHSDSLAVTGERQLAATTQKLHELLKQREFHLAELIDEVVYAEAREGEAIRGNLTVQEGVNQLESAFQQFLQYHVTLTEEVLLPALLDALDARLQRSVAATTASPADSLLDGKTRSTLQGLLVSSALSPATQQLVKRVLETEAKAPASRALDAAPAGAPSALDETHRGPGSNQTIEQAVVLSGMLLHKQRALLADLEEVRVKLSVAAGIAALELDAPQSHTSPSPRRRGSSAEALMTINREARRRSAASAAGGAQAADDVDVLQDRVNALQRERDALWEQLQRREKDDSTVSSLLADKRQLETELLYAQRRTLEEQYRNRDLRHQVTDLEAALTRAQKANQQGLVNTEEELHRLARGADVARTSLECEVERLRNENRALVESSERLMQNSSSGEVAAKRKVAKLEGVVAALKTDLNIVESRLAVIQDQREAERHRIISQFEHEQQRLRRERDECQQLVEKMAAELKLLSADHNAMRGAALVDRL